MLLRLSLNVYSVLQFLLPLFSIMQFITIEGRKFSVDYNLIQPTISLEMPVPSQGHYGFHSFPVVDWFCLFIYLW
jgi:hypothetical protein